MRRGISVFILITACLGAGAAVQGGLTAQTSQAPPGQDILPALLVEVRGLRAAMEEMASAGPRVQLALGRLQLQEQRVTNLLRRLETVRASLTATQQQDDNIRQQMASTEESSKSGVLPEGISRTQFEQLVQEQLGSLKIESGRLATQVQRLQVEESGIVQELASEQGRWTDINQRMEELERALTRK
jgi:hypothetical protein